MASEILFVEVNFLKKKILFLQKMTSRIRHTLLVDSPQKTYILKKDQDL